MLDRVRIAVRPRTAWEAMDLGLALLRAQAGPVAKVWLATALPLGAVLLLACWRHPHWAPLLFWWLLPALDRPVLHVLAKAAFGEAPGWRDTLRAAPDYARRGLVASLLWRRAGGERSLLLPVWQLEGADGPAYRRRCKVLLARNRVQARNLTGVGQLATAVLVLGALGAISLVTPDTSTARLLEALSGSGPHRWLGILAPVLAVAALAAVEPFYLAAGFGLYLNRRVQLEGWDLELAFRGLAQRLRSRAGTGAVLLLALLLALPGTKAGAAPPPDPKTELAEVMKAPEFATRRSGWTLRRRRPAPSTQARPAPSWLVALGQGLARSLRWLLPAALVLGLLWLLWRHRRALLPAPSRPDPGKPPERLFGLDIRPGALPADLPGAAQALWDQGDPRAALALLYRGALARLARQAPLGAAATEAECGILAERHLPGPAAAYFTRLLHAWQATAYGGRVPPPADRDLCAAWAGHFGGRP